MSGDDFARLAYLIILASAIGGWVLVESRGRVGATLRMLLAWVLIFVGVAAAYGLWQDFNATGQRQTLVQDGGQRIEIARSQDNHYYLSLRVGDLPIRFMVDTGATSIVLSDRDADRLGIDRNSLVFLGEARTANGTIRTARVPLRNVSLEDTTMGDFTAFVGEGQLDVSLLGMDFLSRFESVEIARDRLILKR